MKFFNGLKSRKGLSGADVAVAISVIVLTVGIVTAIYVNTINKSKDNLRYANAVRIATSIIENIQRFPYEYVIANVGSDVTGGNKLYNTKVPSGFRATVTLSSAQNPDIARDVIVSITYKGGSSYKTITLSTIKERELMDMTNSPDISLIDGYKPIYNSSDTKYYFYPVKVNGANYIVTTTTDIEWYDYEVGKYALVYKTVDGTINVGTTGTFSSISENVYAWIPRFVASSGTSLSSVKFLYGSSDYIIALNNYGSLISYGVIYSGTISNDSTPVKYSSGYYYNNSGFSKNDGLSGVWYCIGGTNTDSVANIAIKFNSKIECTNVTLID